jgi:hypothetical protein
LPFPQTHLSANLADQELRRLAAGLITVGQMSRGDGESTGADKIASCAEDLESVGRVVGDGTTVLKVLGVSEEYGTNDLVAHSSVEVTDGGSGERGTLTTLIVSMVGLYAWNVISRTYE